FTDQQRAAIETRGINVSLSAGAGCGKTFVLSERFLAQLEPGDDDAPPADRLYQVVAITFTDRAAREMRDRIRNKCFERLETAPPGQADYWLQLSRGLDSARVGTIHSFCGALLRIHAVEAELDPHFIVIEQTQADTLLAELTEDILRERLSHIEDKHHEAVMNLTAQFGLDRLREMLMSLAARGRSLDFDTWLRASPDEIVSRWEKFHEREVLPELLAQLVGSAAARELLSFLQSINPPPALVDVRHQLLTRLPRLSDEKDPVAAAFELREAAKLPDRDRAAWPDPDDY